MVAEAAAEVATSEVAILNSKAEVEAAEQLPLTPWAPNYKFHYVVLEPDDATGREFTMGEEPDHDL